MDGQRDDSVDDVMRKLRGEALTMTKVFFPFRRPGPSLIS